MTKSKFFATTGDEIAKAPVDFYSIGHILMGQIIFFVVYAILKWPLAEKVSDIEVWAIIIAIISGIVWEPIENIILYKLGLKYENKRDSIANAIFDIIFVTLGALLAHWINNWEINLTLVIVEFTIFFILYVYFSKKE
ncbi:MAG: DUF2585 family protein [Promethearchaeota archaeon]